MVLCNSLMQFTVGCTRIVWDLAWHGLNFMNLFFCLKTICLHYTKKKNKHGQTTLKWDWAIFSRDSVDCINATPKCKFQSMDFDSCSFARWMNQKKKKTNYIEHWTQLPMKILHVPFTWILNVNSVFHPKLMSLNASVPRLIL